MNTLIIYDSEGYILFQSSGDHLREPVGVPFMWVYVPATKYVERIDVKSEIHTAIFADLPKGTEQIMQDRITDLELTIAEMLAM